jgi:lipopolysaccharide/colanic/teichoic acid biosynthesis glycosyltransferase
MGSLYQSFGKRLFDVAAASLMLAAISPLLAVLAILTWLRIGRPVFFRQERPGLGGRPFMMLKFRTMRVARDASGRDLPDEARLVPFGERMRRRSLDELPELLNVIGGEMSLVGPRPLLMRYLDRYTPDQRRRHDVRPGITGWTQVNGRNALSWEEKFALDQWYVDHLSFALDLRILAMTIRQILWPSGISHPEHATMPEFRGTGPATADGERRR